MLLWGGGIYDWFDPVTIVYAVERVPEAHLVFMAAGHPNPELPVARALAAAREAAGPRVHFHDGWVDYERRADWLLDADVGVSAHLDHVEARFAFRTRILDYLWAGLPVLCSGGDALSEEVAARDLGEVVPPGDLGALVAAVDRLRDPGRRDGCGGRARVAGAERAWDSVAVPLVEYCADPWRAPDLVGREYAARRPGQGTVLARRAAGRLRRALHPRR
jgi:glycosyltransferase involved in cell wall biosynthesis